MGIIILIFSMSAFGGTGDWETSGQLEPDEGFTGAWYRTMNYCDAIVKGKDWFSGPSEIVAWAKSNCPNPDWMRLAVESDANGAYMPGGSQCDYRYDCVFLREYVSYSQQYYYRHTFYSDVDFTDAESKNWRDDYKDAWYALDPSILTQQQCTDWAPDGNYEYYYNATSAAEADSVASLACNVARVATGLDGCTYVVDQSQPCVCIVTGGTQVNDPAWLVSCLAGLTAELSEVPADSAIDSDPQPKEVAKTESTVGDCELTSSVRRSLEWNSELGINEECEYTTYTSAGENCLDEWSDTYKVCRGIDLFGREIETQTETTRDGQGQVLTETTSTSVGDSGQSIGDAPKFDGEGNRVSGGGDCAAPPSCTGDLLQCEMIRQQWLLRCRPGEGESDLAAAEVWADEELVRGLGTWTGALDGSESEYQGIGNDPSGLLPVGSEGDISGWGSVFPSGAACTQDVVFPLGLMAGHDAEFRITCEQVGLIKAALTVFIWLYVALHLRTVFFRPRTM